MAVPRNRHSRARSGRKRSQQAKSPVSLAVCTNCGSKHRPHRVCPYCGFYKGKQVVNVASPVNPE